MEAYTVNDNEANRLIAEACGWKPDGYGHWKHPTRNLSEDVESLPDYCHDLNAMHEAEKLLYKNNFISHLRRVLISDHIDCLENCVFATARQRAEAFLRVKGLWKEKGGK
jgi:hypothetical protein